jgi:UDP-glucose 4-epimerase
MPFMNDPLQQPTAPRRALNNVLVTGGAGFIGSHLVESLVGGGARVTVVDDFSTGRLEHLVGVRHGITLIESELATAVRDRRLPYRHFDAIFHLAGNPYVPWSVDDPRSDYTRNLHASFELLEALRALDTPPLLIYASSGAIYGDPGPGPIGEDCALAPISPYGVSKLAVEQYATVYSRQFGVPTVSLRFFSVYGPRQRKQVVYDLIRKCRADAKRLEVHGDGSQERDFLHVTDLVRAILMVGERCFGRGEAYNVASGISHTLASLVDTVCRVCGASPLVSYTGAVRPGDAQRWRVDVGALARFGFRPQIALEQGVAEVRDWYDRTVPEPSRLTSIQEAV